jgi:SH3-like domain-containing protein
MLSSVLADEDPRSRIGRRSVHACVTHDKHGVCNLGSMRWHAAVLLLLATFVAGAHAAGPAPHYASLRTDKAYLREGPTYAHRILWIYRRKGYPVRVIAAFDIWRRVEDADGTLGWMNASMLTDRRTVLVMGKSRVPLGAAAGARARIVAWAEPGVVAALKACEVSQCKISAGGTDGWIDKKNIWGVDAGETLQ